MSLKNKLITVLSVAGATALLATASFAQDSNSTTNPTDKASNPQKTERGFGKRGSGDRKFGGRQGERGMRHGRGMGMMLRGLDLTDAQKTQIQSIMAANKPTQATRDEMRTLMHGQADRHLDNRPTEPFDGPSHRCRTERNRGSRADPVGPDSRTESQARPAQAGDAAAYGTAETVASAEADGHRTDR